MIVHLVICSGYDTFSGRYYCVCALDLLTTTTMATMSTTTMTTNEQQKRVTTIQPDKFSDRSFFSASLSIACHVLCVSLFLLFSFVFRSFPLLFLIVHTFSKLVQELFYNTQLASSSCSL